MKYRKKSVMIDAWRLPHVINLKNWKIFRKQYNLPNWPIGSRRGEIGIVIPTIGGDHIASADDYIIRGVVGEFYPCKPDIFIATYELA